MNKKGFISTTLIYTFLVLFIFINVSILLIYVKKNSFHNVVKDKLKKELEIIYNESNYGEAPTSKWYNSCSATTVDLNCELITSSSPQSDESLDLTQPSSPTNGNGFYYTHDNTYNENGERIYYFRGNVNNNNVIFNGFCWLIVRTTDLGGIKLLYNGIPNNNTCSNGKDSLSVFINTSGNFNTYEDDNTFIGYMTGRNSAGNNTQSLEESLSNNYDSKVKIIIDEWFGLNMNNVKGRLENSIWCNERSLDPNNSDNTIYSGFGNTLSYYMKSSNQKYPRYLCSNDSIDGFSLSKDSGGSEKKGNNKLVYPVGLLTMDEVIYSGVTTSGTSDSYLINNVIPWWTMSSHSFNTKPYIYYVNTNARLLYSSVKSLYATRVSVVLKSDASVISGDGTVNSPYIVE